jgi:uncharacterized membrane protein HdeD (DUF308 family)
MHEKIRLILLFIHSVSGTFALSSGVVSMVAQKGHKYHRTFGKIYFWSMFGIFITAVPLSMMMRHFFLFYSAIFSFYLAFTGYRHTQNKKPISGRVGKKIDVFASVLAIVVSAIIMVLAVRTAYTVSIHDALVPFIFGALCISFGYADLNLFSKLYAPKEYGLSWMFGHLSRMIGSYISAFTAFSIVTFRSLPENVNWLYPSVLGSVGVSLAVRFYQRKFAHKITNKKPLTQPKSIEATANIHKS